MKFAEVPMEKWPVKGDENPPCKVFLSDKFLVQLRQCGSIEKSYKRITVNKVKRSTSRLGHWDDGITWDELQQIKNAVGFADKWVVEIYPPESDLVNVANMRHLTVLDEKPFYAF